MFRFFRFFLDLFKIKKKKKTKTPAAPLFPSYQSLEDFGSLCDVCKKEMYEAEFIVKKQLSVYQFCCEDCYLYWVKERAHILGK
tara:strand:+ start:1051 stop:1302 length:252 start_codon:yes stop_codon:yes gene_type:complete